MGLLSVSHRSYHRAPFMSLLVLTRGITVQRSRPDEEVQRILRCTDRVEGADDTPDHVLVRTLVVYRDSKFYTRGLLRHTKIPQSRAGTGLYLESLVVPNPRTLCRSSGMYIRPLGSGLRRLGDGSEEGGLGEPTVTRRHHLKTNTKKQNTTTERPTSPKKLITRVSNGP